MGPIEREEKIIRDAVDRGDMTDDEANEAMVELERDARDYSFQNDHDAFERDIERR